MPIFSNRFVSFFFLATLISCFAIKKNKSNIQQDYKEIIISDSYIENKDAINVHSLFIKDSILYISVKSDIGCNEDDFNLYTNNSILKSLPPKKKLFLDQIPHTGNCEGALDRELAFNIKKLYENAAKNLVLVIKDKSVSLSE